MHRTLIALVLLLVSSAHASSAGACYVISDPDSRTMCLARAHKDSGRCYSIKDSAKRSECLAEIRD